MATVRVKPREGLVVLDDNGKEIPARGAEVKKSVRIVREIREGSLIVVKTIKKQKDEGGN